MSWIRRMKVGLEHRQSKGESSSPHPTANTATPLELPAADLASAPDQNTNSEGREGF